jgi:hypothetical protein
MSVTPDVFLAPQPTADPLPPVQPRSRPMGFVRA